MIRIIGCGRLGRSIAKRLVADGVQVTVLDHEQKNFDASLPRDFCGRMVLGMEIDSDVLIRAGI